MKPTTSQYEGQSLGRATSEGLQMYVMGTCQDQSGKYTLKSKLQRCACERGRHVSKGLQMYKIGTLRMYGKLQ